MIHSLSIKTYHFLIQIYKNHLIRAYLLTRKTKRTEKIMNVEKIGDRVEEQGVYC